MVFASIKLYSVSVLSKDSVFIMRNKDTHTNNSQQGNVLFYILIAVALFAALSFAVSQGGRGGGFDLSDERAEMLAGEFLDYGASLEQAVQRMLNRGISESDLCFDIDEYPGGNTDYEHAGCANTSNRVFHPAGGGVSYKEMPSEFFDPDLSADTRYGESYITGISWVYGLVSSNSELMLQIIAVNLPVCSAIVRMANPDNTSGTPLLDNPDGLITRLNRPYIGMFNADNIRIERPTAKVSCIEGRISGASDGYVAFYVLHAR